MPATAATRKLTEAQRLLCEQWIDLPGYVVDQKLDPRLVRSCGGRSEAVSALTLALVQAARRYDPDRGAFATYAIRCMRLCAMKVARRGALVKVPDGLPVAVVRSASFDLVEGSETTADWTMQEVVLSVLGELTETEQGLLRDHFGLGCPQLNCAEIGRKRGRSEVWARGQLRDALESLKRVYEPLRR